MGWRRVCCPVDFSWESRIAMQEAVELASHFDCELTLVHVDDRPARPRADETLASPETLERGTLELERQLDTWRNQAEQLMKKPVKCVLLAGEPAEEIVRFARGGSYDAIVMGTHGQAGRHRWVVGSVAQSVVREAPCTVTVVRPAGARRSAGSGDSPP
jgi:nucleotide-binding universal stress UspA family protein